MRQLMVIIKKDLKETLHTKAFYGSIALVLVILVTLGMGLRGVIEAMIEGGPSLTQTTSALQSLIGTMAFMLSLMLMILFTMYINAYTVTTEKMKHSLESLLCTPLSLRQIWLGKSLATTLPSVILGLAFSFGSIAIVNQFFIAPKLGYSIFPGAAPLVATLVVAPLIVFGIASLMMALQFIISNIRWINAAIIGVIFGVSFGLSPLLKFGPESWNIVSIALGLAAILAVVTIFLSHLVTKEKIVLTSKG